MNGRHIPLIMIVHGIQVPRVRAASLVLTHQVLANLESPARTHQALGRVGSQVAQTTIPTIIRDMMIGYHLVISLNGLPQMVRVGRAIPVVS